MNPSFYVEKWSSIRNSGRINLAEEMHHLCSRIALSFLDRYYYNDNFSGEYIDLLCEMATCGNPEVMPAASSSLFGMVIESLCDDFEELQTEAYNRVMSRIITHCRILPEGVDLDAKLKEFGLDSAEKIYGRIERLRSEAIWRCDIRNLKKAIILSRVTIGADIAVTSVIMQRVSAMNPGIELVLVGDSKLRSVFGGNPNLKFRDLNYMRRGSLLERISAWHNVLDVIKDETSSCRENEFVLIDTDSRLSQLGVLPLVNDSNYLFFKSRGGGESLHKKISMAELANLWADSVFCEKAFAYPKLWLPEAIARRGLEIARKIRLAGCKNLISVNFGVGGNSRKRIEGDFEQKLLLRLLADEGTVIMLDKGFGKDELLRTDAIMRALESAGVYTADAGFSEGNIVFEASHGVIGINAEIGEAASLISASDRYVGYDSACQHIAAAAKVRATTIFAGTNNTRFVRRWRAFGAERTDLIHVDTLSRSVFFDNKDIIDRIIEVGR